MQQSCYELQQKVLLCEDTMKAFLSAVVVALVVAAAAPFALPGLQKDAATAFSTSSTRVGDPGHNLVGAH